MSNVIDIKSYLFGEYRVDPGSQAVYRNGRQVNLNPIRTTVLIALIERAGQVVPKEEIIGRIWPDQTGSSKGDSNLTQQIFYLRRFFHDNPSSPTYILTIPGTGYLFYPTVRALLSDDREVEVWGTTPAAEESGEELGAEVRPDGTRDAGVPPPRVLDVGATGPGRSPGERLAVSLLRFLILPGIIVGFCYLINLWFAGSVQGLDVKESTVSTLVSRPGRKEGLAYSPDGRMLAFLDEGRTNDTVDLFVWRAASNDVVQLTDNPLLEKTIAWSPDNKQIAFLRWANGGSRKYSIYTVPAFGGPERQIGEAIDGLDWDPGGRYLAISDDEGPGTPTGIYLLSVDGRQRMPLSHPLPGTNLFDFEPKFSPDGREVVFTRWSSALSGEIFIVDRQTGQLRQLTFDGKVARLAKWSRNGQEILFVSNRNGNWRIWRIPKNGGLPRLVESIVGEIASFSISPFANEIAFVERFEDSDLQLHWLNPPSGEGYSEPPCAANSTQPDHSPQFSPDGKNVVFVSKRTGIAEIWITDSACQKARQLTNFRIGGVGSPQWAPDGEEIVFDFFHNNHADIYKIDLIGGQLTRLTKDPGSEYLPSWSNDGLWIYFSSDRPGLKKDSQRSQVWKMPANGGEAIQVTENGGQEPFQSHDGRLLYYIRDDQIWTKELPSGMEKKLEALSDFRLERYWTLNRTTLFLLVPEKNGISRLISLDLKTQQLRTIHEAVGSRAPYDSGLSISADQRRIAISLIDKSFANIAVVRNWE